MTTVREDLEVALVAWKAASDAEDRWHKTHSLTGRQRMYRLYEEAERLHGLALDRARAEPEESICTAACDQPSEQHTTSDCPCWEHGYRAGTEAQREPAGRGTP